MEISAQQVKELRERTGAGMMDCKKALVEADGDIEAAIEAMRKAGVAKAAKKAGRIAAEGVIVLRANPAGGEAVMVEVNCETDFVAKDANFRKFAEAVAATLLARRPLDVTALSGLPLSSGDGTVEEARQQLVLKIGENISVRRFVLFKRAGNLLGSYSHGGRIGVLVDVQGGSAALAKDLAMHIAASRPVCVTEREVPADLLAKERVIVAAQVADSGKPPAIQEKMIAGKLEKFVKEIALVGQPFVKNPELTVGKLLQEAGASVLGFVRFEVGEGIEKKVDDFAAEVMAQARGG
jgi:elongation factor Ts